MANHIAASLLPASFRGTADEDAFGWLKRFERYATFTGLDDASKLQLLLLLMSDNAEAWLETLTAANLASYNSLKTVFEEKFINAPHMSVQRRIEAVNRIQKPNESVDEYFTRAASKMNALNYDGTLQQALLLNNLRPEIGTIMYQHLPFQNVEGLMEKAKYVELSLKDCYEESESTMHAEKTESKVNVATKKDDTDVVDTLTAAMTALTNTLQRCDSSWSDPPTRHDLN